MIKANITKLKEMPKACADCPYFGMDNSNFIGLPVCKISSMVIDVYRINISNDKDSNCPLYEEASRSSTIGFVCYCARQKFKKIFEQALVFRNFKMYNTLKTHIDNFEVAND